MDTPQFIPGLELSRQFYLQAVQPILQAHFPDLPHSAALLGAGSEVLGFDTPMSRDHDWGPRVTLYLPEDTSSELNARLEQTLRPALPETFLGYPLNWNIGGPSGYTCIEFTTISAWFTHYLGTDLRRPLMPADWLAFPQQKLRTITSGGVFHDALNLQALRASLAWFPPDLWLYLLACGWQRISQEEHLMGRAGFVGDELGSSLIAARLVRDVMRLGFLMERVYAPYPKWFGTAFSRLDCAQTLTPLLAQTLSTGAWQERQRCLAAACELLAAQHNHLGLTEPLDTQPRPFFDRPFLVIEAGRFVQALTTRISDPAVQDLAASRPEGSADQFSDSTDFLNHPQLWKMA